MLCSFVAFLIIKEVSRPITDFDRVIKLRPEHAAAWFARGLTYKDRGEVGLLKISIAPKDRIRLIMISQNQPSNEEAEAATKPRKFTTASQQGLFLPLYWLNRKICPVFCCNCIVEVYPGIRQ